MVAGDSSSRGVAGRRLGEAAVAVVEGEPGVEVPAERKLGEEAAVERKTSVVAVVRKEGDWGASKSALMAVMGAGETPVSAYLHLLGLIPSR